MIRKTTLALIVIAAIELAAAVWIVGLPSPNAPEIVSDGTHHP